MDFLNAVFIICQRAVRTFAGMMDTLCRTPRLWLLWWSEATTCRWSKHVHTPHLAWTLILVFVVVLLCNSIDVRDWLSSGWTESSDHHCVFASPERWWRWCRRRWRIEGKKCRWCTRAVPRLHYCITWQCTRFIATSAKSGHRLVWWGRSEFRFDDGGAYIEMVADSRGGFRTWFQREWTCVGSTHKSARPAWSNYHYEKRWLFVFAEDDSDWDLDARHVFPQRRGRALHDQCFLGQHSFHDAGYADDDTGCLQPNVVALFRRCDSIF